MIIAMLFRVIFMIIAVTSLFNMHTTVEMLRLSPNQGGTNLCFDRETSLVG